MRPYSQKSAYQRRDVLIQGNSVRQTWGLEEPIGEEARKPLRREPPVRVVPSPPSEDILHVRLGE